MSNTNITPFQLCPASTPADARGTPPTGGIAGGHNWKTAHESALLGLAHVLAHLQRDPQAQQHEDDAHGAQDRDGDDGVQHSETPDDARHGDRREDGSAAFAADAAPDRDSPGVRPVADVLHGPAAFRAGLGRLDVLGSRRDAAGRGEHLGRLLCQFGPDGLPVVGAKFTAGDNAFADLLDTDSQLRRCRAIPVCDVLEVPARGFAVDCKRLAPLSVHVKEERFEVHERHYII